MSELALSGADQVLQVNHAVERVQKQLEDGHKIFEEQERPFSQLEWESRRKRCDDIESVLS